MITRKPEPGEIIETVKGEFWKVDHCRFGICYSQEAEQSDTECFIYQFADGHYNKNYRIVGTDIKKHVTEYLNDAPDQKGVNIDEKA